MLAVVVAPASAQITRALPPETVIKSEDIEAKLYEPIVLKGGVEVQENEQAVYNWRVSPPAVGIQLDDGQTLHVWAPKGVYSLELEAVLIDWEGRRLRKVTSSSTLRVAVGDVPDPVVPDPEPEPSVIPDDDYGNLARDVQAWKRGRSPALRAALPFLADIYTEVASRLEGTQSPLIVEIEDATEEVRRRNREALAGRLSPLEYRDALEELKTLLPVLQGRWTPDSNKHDVSAIFHLIALGLKE